MLFFWFSTELLWFYIMVTLLHPNQACIFKVSLEA